KLRQALIKMVSPRPNPGRIRYRDLDVPIPRHLGAHAHYLTQEHTTRVRVRDRIPCEKNLKCMNAPRLTSLRIWVARWSAERSGRVGERGCRVPTRGWAEGILAGDGEESGGPRQDALLPVLVPQAGDEGKRRDVLGPVLEFGRLEQDEAA